MKDTYCVSALVKGSRATEQIDAYSEKQALFLFRKKWGYKGLRDLYAYVTKKAASNEQLSLF